MHHITYCGAFLHVDGVGPPYALARSGDVIVPHHWFHSQYINHNDRDNIKRLCIFFLRVSIIFYDVVKFNDTDVDLPWDAATSLLRCSVALYFFFIYILTYFEFFVFKFCCLEIPGCGVEDFWWSLCKKLFWMCKKRDPLSMVIVE